MRDLFVASSKQAKFPKKHVVVLLKKNKKTKTRNIWKLPFYKNIEHKIKSLQVPQKQIPTVSVDSSAPSLSSQNPTPVKHPSRKGIHLFSAIGKDPTSMYFQNQDPEENVLLFVRKAFITNFPWIITGILLLIAPIFVTPLIPLLNIQLDIPVRFYLFFSLLYYIVIATYVYINFITWYFNIALVTNIRIFEVILSGIVFKDVSATKITLIQDVSYNQIGVLRTIFDYGDVLIQTAGTVDIFTFKAVPQPENVVHIIEELIGKEEGV